MQNPSWKWLGALWLIVPSAAAANDIEDALNGGLQALQESRHELAISCFSNLIRLEPNEPRGYFNRGIAFTLSKDVDRAFADFSEAIRLDSNLPSAYVNRGTIHLHRGDVSKAVADFSQAVRLDPKNIIASTNRASAYIIVGRYDLAVTDATEAIRLDPRLAEARHIRATAYYPLKKYDEAIADETEALQEEPSTRYSEHGIIPIDNTLLDHHGELIEDVGWFWDHADHRYLIAHDYIFINYVCPNGKHYPLDFRRFRKEEHCATKKLTFQDHTALCQELIDGACDQRIPGTFAFDIYFTSAAVLNHVHGKHLADGQPRGYVGSLKFNRNLEYKGRLIKASALAASIKPEVRKPMQEGERKQWYFTCTLRIPEVNHRVRILIIWQGRDDEQARIILVTNRLMWEASRVVRGYRHRWTGTETFHRDGKQQLGMGDCQLRDGEGQTRHMHLVMLAYSLLMKQLRQCHAYEWAYQQLTTIGEACRAVLRETLRTTLTWAMEHAKEGPWGTEEVVAYLGLAEPTN